MVTAPTTRTTRQKALRFTAHYAEMVVAMLIGMVALAPLWPADWTARADVNALAMATNMTVAMGLWMAVRRHPLPRVAEMCAVMYLPFLALLVPHWMGALSGSTLMTLGHVIMFPLMLAAMAYRRSDYWH